MRQREIHSTLVVLLMSLVIAWASAASAQYEVRQWANFEDGKLPADAITVGPLHEQRITVVDLSKVQGMPPEFRSPEAVKETGQMGLLLKAGPTPNGALYHTGLILGITLDRDQLGEKGRALFQADFFIGSDRMPSLAVLAAEPQQVKEDAGRAIPEVSHAFHRFGMTLGKQLYYSFLASGAAAPKTYVNDPALFGRIPRPGWHRFAIVCEGLDKFSCYIDGQKTVFSPVVEKTVRKLVVGVLCADKTDSYDCYVDNLSIQVSNEAPEMPASPYAASWGGSGSVAPTDSVAPAIQPQVPAGVAAVTPGVEWLEPEEAWARAQQAGKPMLLYFHAPGIGLVEQIETMFQSDPAAKAFLARHACARVDVNQLKGGTIAKAYGVYRVPTMILIAPDTSWHKRTTPGRNFTWQQIEAELSY